MKHHYAPDISGGTDHRGRWPCLHCPLPRENQIHHNVPQDEVSDRIVGERRETDATSLGSPRHVDA